MVTALFEKILEGGLIEAVVSVYTNAMGSYFWLLLFGLGFFMVYMKTNNIAITSMLGLVVMSIISPLIFTGDMAGNVMKIIMLIAVMGITVVVYKVTH